MNAVTVTEKVIEDILSADKSILADVLSLNQGDLSPIARQKRFDSRNNRCPKIIRRENICNH